MGGRHHWKLWEAPQHYLSPDIEKVYSVCLHASRKWTAPSTPITKTNASWKQVEKSIVLPISSISLRRALACDCAIKTVYLDLISSTGNTISTQPRSWLNARYVGHFLDEIDWALLPKSANLRCHPVQLSLSIATNSRPGPEMPEKQANTWNKHVPTSTAEFPILLDLLWSKFSTWTGKAGHPLKRRGLSARYSRLLKTSSKHPETSDKSCKI